jgi:hypothetical protein
MANTRDAVRRAQQLDDRHENGGSPASENPSSGRWRFVVAIEQEQ